MTALVLGARDGLVALAKDAGLPTEPAPGFETDLLTLAAPALGVAAGSLHAINRLDVPVSGVVVVASTPEARRVAARLLEGHRVRRRYLGLLGAPIEPPTGCLTGAIGRARGGFRIGGSDPRAATTAYATVRSTSVATLTAFEPRTGRTHQIRLHAAAAGRPLLLDRRYGGAVRLTCSDGRVVSAEGIALHAARFTLPLADGPWVVAAPIPLRLRQVWKALGGEDADWDAGLDAAVPPCEVPEGS